MVTGEVEHLQQTWNENGGHGRWAVRRHKRSSYPVMRVMYLISFVWLLTYGQTLNLDQYDFRWNRLKSAINQKLLALAKGRGIVFHQDNARTYTSIVTLQNRRHFCWEVLKHLVETFNRVEVCLCFQWQVLYWILWKLTFGQCSCLFIRWIMSKAQVNSYCCRRLPGLTHQMSSSSTFLHHTAGRAWRVTSGVWFWFVKRRLLLLIDAIIAESKECLQLLAARCQSEGPNEIRFRLYWLQKPCIYIYI